MKKIGTPLLLLLIAFFVWMLYDYLSYRHHNAVSNAAFVKSDAIYTLGFKVGGKITQVNYQEGDRVDANATLALLDASDFQIAYEELDHAIKALESKQQALRSKRERLFKELGIKSDISQNNIHLSDTKKESISFRLKSLQPQIDKLAKDRKRYRSLLHSHLISEADFEAIDSKYKTLLDQKSALQKELESFSESIQNVRYSHHLSQLEQNQVKELDLDIQALSEQIQAQKEHAKLLAQKIDYCRLKSPIKGVIAKRFANVGRVVGKGSPIYAVVDPHHKHVEVLLSEKKLHGIKAGNKATITTEALKKRELNGVVESIAPTSASTFSLVPRDIASGEFTKLDQRFVVRIRIEEDPKIVDQLYIGMGASVAIERSE